MSVIHGNKIGISYGAYDVLSGISFALAAGAKVGIVGPNGIGKTSLLRVLAGGAQPSEGRVHVSRGTRTGYLRQEAIDAFVRNGHSLFGEMETVFAHLQSDAERMRAFEARMAAGDTSDELLDEYGALQHAYEQAGGYEYDVRIRRVLEGLGFPPSQWQSPIEHLSGGQQTRALLARLLLESPDLLILDEPTNHLDVDAVEWLEGTLRTWNGSLIIASHDRYFLDRVVDTVWELGAEHLESYRGNYSAYLRQRTERWERNMAVFTSEMERLWHALETIERYFAWRKYEEAKGRLQLLGRELVAIEHYGLLNVQGKKWSQFGLSAPSLMTVGEARERMKAIRPPQPPPPPMRFHLDEGRRSGFTVLQTEELHVGYDGVSLVAAGDLLIERGDRVALVGPNGAGKTTFLRTVLGELPVVTGRVHAGVNVKLGYFAQAHDGLDPDLSVFDQLMLHTSMSPGETRGYLARYLFRGDDVWKPVGGLSGGERARLALAILALDGVNLLLLDEPTNHLDIPSQEVLQEALEGYEGTILMVSHDRYLVDRLATHIWEIRDGRLTRFKGSYAEFQEARTAPQESSAASESKRREKPSVRRAENDRSAAALEREIGELERTIDDLAGRIQGRIDSGDFIEAARLEDERVATSTHLEALVEEWARGVPA
jgi:ATP-binding cassette subfamily F protein 3